MALITELYRLIPEHKIFFGMRIVACYTGDLAVFFKGKRLGHLHLGLHINPVLAGSYPLFMAIPAEFCDVAFYDKTLMRFMAYIAVIGPYGQ